MKRSLAAVPAALSLLALLGTAACSAAPEGADSASADQALGTAITGYYEMTSNTLTERWLEAIALDADGTFVANVGDGVSNLSGHHFAASGTYTFAASTLALTYAWNGIGAATTDHYRVDVRGDSLDATFLDDDGESRFTMTRTKLTTLTFGADWTDEADGPLVAGRALRVRYAASRDRCKAPSSGGLFVDASSSADLGLTQFGQVPVGGYLSALGSVPATDHVDLWFEVGAENAQLESVCSAWDSSFGKNYPFVITGT